MSSPNTPEPTSEIQNTGRHSLRTPLDLLSRVIRGITDRVKGIHNLEDSPLNAPYTVAQQYIMDYDRIHAGASYYALSLDSDLGYIMSLLETVQETIAGQDDDYRGLQDTLTQLEQEYDTQTAELASLAKKKMTESTNIKRAQTAMKNVLQKQRERHTGENPNEVNVSDSMDDFEAKQQLLLEYPERIFDTKINQPGIQDTQNSTAYIQITIRINEIKTRRKQVEAGIRDTKKAIQDKKEELTPNLTTLMNLVRETKEGFYFADKRLMPEFDKKITVIETQLGRCTELDNPKTRASITKLIAHMRKVQQSKTDIEAAKKTTDKTNYPKNLITAGSQIPMSIADYVNQAIQLGTPRESTISGLLNLASSYLALIMGLNNAIDAHESPNQFTDAQIYLKNYGDRLSKLIIATKSSKVNKGYIEGHLQKFFEFLTDPNQNPWIKHPEITSLSPRGSLVEYIPDRLDLPGKNIISLHNKEFPAQYEYLNKVKAQYPFLNTILPTGQEEYRKHYDGSIDYGGPNRGPFTLQEIGRLISLSTELDEEIVDIAHVILNQAEFCTWLMTSKEGENKKYRNINPEFEAWIGEYLPNVIEDKIIRQKNVKDKTIKEIRTNDIGQAISSLDRPKKIQLTKFLITHFIRWEKLITTTQKEEEEEKKKKKKPI